MENEALEARLGLMERALQEMKARSSENNKDIFTRLGQLEQQHARTDEQYKRIMDELDSLKAQQAEVKALLLQLQQKPAKRWESMIGNAISAIVAAAIGFLAAGLNK